MPEQFLTAEQLAARNEFCQTYNLEPKQIFFDHNNAEPYFDFAALAHLAAELGDFMDISVETLALNTKSQSVTVSCLVTSERGFTRAATGSCVVGAVLPDGVIADERQAENVARARALRHALTLAGFSILRAHRLRQQDTSLEALPPRTEEETRKKELAEIHIIAGQIGWSEQEYRDKLNIFFDVRSATDLTPPQRRECVELFRNLSTLPLDQRAERITFGRGAKWERERQRRLAEAAQLPAAA